MRLAAVVVAIGLAVTTHAQDRLSGRCVGVTDGDSIKVLVDGSEVAIRLGGIDAPENGQDFGDRAKQKLSDLVYGREVTVLARSEDRYGRTVARILVGGRDASLELVRAGLAWHFTQYSNDQELSNEEAQARARRVGLWSASNPVAPWEFRRGNRSLADLGREVQLKQNRIDGLPVTQPRPLAAPRKPGQSTGAEPASGEPAGQQHGEAGTTPGSCWPSAWITGSRYVAALEWQFDIEIQTNGCCTSGRIDLSARFRDSATSHSYEMSRVERWSIRSPGGAGTVTTYLNALSSTALLDQAVLVSVRCD